MNRTRKLLCVVAAVAATTCLAGYFLRSRAPDFWAYGKLSMADGTPQSPVYFVEVRGVGARPTIAYLVRCPSQAAAPRNMADVSHSVVNHFNERTRVIDRWRSDFVLLVGRHVGETIEIPLDKSVVFEWFGPGANIENFAACQRFWEKHVAPQLVVIDRQQSDAG